MKTEDRNIGEHPAEESEANSFEGYFRDPGFAAESSLGWALGQRLDAIDALRGLLSGGQATARLRMWVFLEVAAQPQARLQREDLNQLFHGLKPEALDMALKRLRDLGLLIWEATTQDYHLSPVALQVQALLAPLTRTASEAELESLAVAASGFIAVICCQSSAVAFQLTPRSIAFPSRFLPDHTAQKSGSSDFGRCCSGSATICTSTGSSDAQPSRMAWRDGKDGKSRSSPRRLSGTSLWTSSWSRSLLIRCSR